MSLRLGLRSNATTLNSIVHQFSGGFSPPNSPDPTNTLYFLTDNALARRVQNDDIIMYFNSNIYNFLQFSYFLIASKSNTNKVDNVNNVYLRVRQQKKTPSRFNVDERPRVEKQMEISFFEKNSKIH